ncbi:hypothetical protein ACFX2I_038585 [Malus domestica]
MPRNPKQVFNQYAGVGLKALSCILEEASAVYSQIHSRFRFEFSRTVVCCRSWTEGAIVHCGGSKDESYCFKGVVTNSHVYRHVIHNLSCNAV